MPIVSVSLSENLKKFINKLVSKNQYENRSKLIRDALLRLMSTEDISSTLDEFSDFTPLTKNIIGNMIIVAPNDLNIQKKLNRIESEYNDQIVSKNQNFVNQNSITFMIYEGTLQNFQKLVVEINSIEELRNFRYLIIN
ncbi:MAG: type II toxin-antitoxin system ParD family antitoxin [Candidatus Lokiarchaeia archaeon]|nr:type II toxin-antitoxin system ParD family antitoxin [Candidatus Lokiarchaeia archaeon]